MRIATIHLYDNEHIFLPWEKADDPITLSHEITEIEAKRLIPSFCGIIIIGEISPRCDESCDQYRNHQIRVFEEWAWPPAHLLASIAFGCGIKLEDGWLTLNANQCWCLLKNAFNSCTKQQGEQD